MKIRETISGGNILYDREQQQSANCPRVRFRRLFFSLFAAPAASKLVRDKRVTSGADWHWDNMP